MLTVTQSNVAFPIHSLLNAGCWPISILLS